MRSTLGDRRSGPLGPKWINMETFISTRFIGISVFEYRRNFNGPIFRKYAIKSNTKY